MKDKLKVKSSLGEKVYDSYVKKLDRNVKSSHEMFAEDHASDLILYSPYVTDHFIDHGIIKRGENTNLISVFRANLNGQLFGASINKGSDFVTTNAEVRAKAVVEYSRDNFHKTMKTLKDKKKSEYDLYYALRSAALVESIQCDYISGIELSERADTTTGVSLLKRLYSEAAPFRNFIHEMGIDVRDNLALRQFANTSDFREYISKFYNKDLYFQRRIVLLEDKKKIVNDGESVFSMKKIKTPEFTEGLAVNLIRKLGLNVDKIMKKLRESS